MKLIKVLCCEMLLRPSEQPLPVLCPPLLGRTICALLIPKGLSGSLCTEFRFFPKCRLSHVLVRFQSWHRHVSLRPNNFHACPFMRRKSIWEEKDFFFLNSGSLKSLHYEKRATATNYLPNLWLCCKGLWEALFYVPRCSS